jgi:polysaccharide export outer membrane protein
LAADAAWQSTAIAAFALIVVRLFRRRPALRAAILLSAGVLALAAPLLSTAVRHGGGGLLTAPSLGTSDRALADAPNPVTSRFAASALPSNSEFENADTARIDWRGHALSWLVVCWMAASGYLAVRLLRGATAVRRWIRLATPCHDPRIEQALRRAADATGVSPPEMLWSSAFDSPALVALGRPRLLLPLEMPADVDWFLVFCHELAHRARRDNVSRLVVELALTVLPWQPLLWILRGKFRAACEEACDDWAVAAGADPVEFASLLVALIPERRPAFALGMAESRSATRDRILRLLSMTRAVRPRLGLLVGAGSVVAAVAVAITLALLQYHSDPRLVRNMPPWGDLPLAEAIARAAHNPWLARVPTEKDKSILPTYVIETPDILMIKAVRTVPKAPYAIEPGDALEVEIAEPHLQGEFIVDADGYLSLGPDYALLKVAGLTLADARDALGQHLAKTVPDARFSLTLSFAPIQRQIGGEHLVGPDGTITLGTYGAVRVDGMTVAEARAAIQTHLSDYLENPRVSVDVFAYNSQVYYVITEGSGTGDSVVRIPITGNETVLDALAQINGLSRLSNKNIWIARPTPGDLDRDAILPVGFDEITKAATTGTNYQVLPGDRIIVQPKMGRASPDDPAEEFTADAENPSTSSDPIRRSSESY